MEEKVKDCTSSEIKTYDEFLLYLDRDLSTNKGSFIKDSKSLCARAIKFLNKAVEDKYIRQTTMEAYLWLISRKNSIPVRDILDKFVCIEEESISYFN